MAQLDINVKATGIEKTTREIKSLDNEINKTSKDAKNTSTSIGDLTNSISNLSTKTVAVAGSIIAVSKAFYDLTKQGIQYKSLLEDQLTGLTALRVATTKNTDSLGNAITLSQKYNIAQKESLTTLKELQEVNKRTPQQLLETVELYKVLVPTLGKTGASQKELLQVTELLAKASAAYGIQFQQLIAGADGLASGTVEVNSELGRFLKTLGLSNDALKDTNNVSQLVIDKLKPMSGELDTLTVANSNLTNAWNELTGVLAEPIFEPVKESVKVLTKYLEDATVALSKFFDTFRDAENLGSIEQLNTRMIKIYSQIQDKQKQLDNAFDSNKGKYSAELRKLNIDLLSVSKEYEKFTNNNVDATLVIEKQTTKTENNTTKVRTHTKAIKEQTEAIKEQVDMLSTSEIVEYFEMLGDTQNAWLVKEADFYNKWYEIAGENYPKLLEQAKEEYFDKFKEEVEILKTEAFDDFMKFDIDVDTSGFSQIAKEIYSIGDATKEVMKEQELYNKAIREAGKDTSKIAKIEAKHLDNQLEGYSNLAGSISGMFTEGSKAAKAFQVVQATLLVTKNALILAEQMHTATMAAGEAVKATSIATDGVKTISGAAATIATTGSTAPFPLTIPAIAAVIGILAPIMALVGGGSGSGSSISTPSISSGLNFDANRDAIKDTYDPVINRLDRQIDLLESIDKNGSASQLGVEKAVLSFERDYKIFVEDVLEQARRGMVTSAFKNPVEDALWVNTTLENAIGVDVFKTAKNGTKIGLNYDILRQGYNLLDTLLYYEENPTAYSGPLFQAGALEAGYSWAEMKSYVTKQISVSLDEFQSLLGDWTSSLIESMDDLKDAKDDFMGYFDDITGTMFYESQRLSKAFSEIDSLRGKNSFEEYLQNNIEVISELEDFLTEDRINLLLSSKTEDIKAQMDLLDELGRITNMTFDNGARSALDYLDSIELVAEAMTRSRENMQSFKDSFKNSENLLVDSALKIGTSIATTWDELAEQYKDLSGDLLGLTDDELSYLEQAKSYIEDLNVSLLETQQDAIQEQIDGYNDLLTTVRNNISSLESIMSSLTSTIETLRGASNTSEVSLMKFWASLAMTRSLSAGTDYEALSKSVQQTTSYSSALTQSSNFASASDMIFAQKSAANDLADINFTLESEYDVLKAIEENTADTVEALTAKLTQIGTEISNSNSNLSDSLKDIIGATTADEYNTAVNTVNSAYESILGRTPDAEGSSYWTGQILNENMNESTLQDAFYSSPEYIIGSLYSSILKREADTEGLKYWTDQFNKGMSFDEITKAFYASSEFSSIPKFATGGYTGDGGKYDVAGIVHKGEYVVNQEQLRSVGGVAGLESRMNSNNGNLEALVNKLIKENIAMRKLWEQVTLNGNRMKVELVS